MPKQDSLLHQNINDTQKSLTIFVCAQSFHLMNKQSNYIICLLRMLKQASLLHQNINDPQKGLRIFVYAQSFHLMNKQSNYRFCLYVQ
jgi:hypothetical protein